MEVKSKTQAALGPFLTDLRVPLAPLKKLSIRPAVSPAVNLKQPLFATRPSGKASSGLTILNPAEPPYISPEPSTHSPVSIKNGTEEHGGLPSDEDDEASAVDQLCDESFVSCNSSTNVPNAAEPLSEVPDTGDEAAQAFDSPKAPAAVQLSDLFSADSPPPVQVAYRTPQSSPEILYRSNPLVEFSDTSDDEAVVSARQGPDSPSPAIRQTGRATPLFAPSESDADDHVQEASQFGTPEGSSRSRSASPLGSDHGGQLDTEQPEWIERYYDDSEGSLRDFIVDDEDVDEDIDSDHDVSDGDDEEAIRSMKEQGENHPGQVRRRNRPRCSYPADSESEASFSDPAWDHDSAGDDEEDDEDGAVIEWSPGPSRPRKRNPLLDFEALTLSDSDEDSAGPSDTSSRNRPKGVKHCGGTKSGTKKPSARAWAAERVELANAIFRDLDRHVFDKQLGPEGAGAKIEWSKRLLTTAGTASEPKVRQSDGSMKREPKITLSEKVCTGREQILSTVAHEMCHLAAWIISNERKNPHGRVFKSWGQKVMKARRDIEVTTKHSYQIEYKYQWQCVEPDCQRIYKRHSKSIDITKQACGRCRGKLKPMFETKENPFQAYLKNNMALAKASMPFASHGDVMRALSRRWTEAGPLADHGAFWREAGLAGRLV